MVHSTLAIVRQRVHAMALGREDLKDHGALRRDPALQAAAGRDGELASPSTLCRWRRCCSRATGTRRGGRGAVLALLVRALRREWPEVDIVFRGDCGFCRRRVLRWCESRGVGYVVGPPTNSRLKALAGPAVGAPRRCTA